MRWLGLIGLVALPAMADTVTATRTIRSQTVLEPQDVSLMPGEIPGTLSDIRDALGLESRVILYAGQPIRAQDLGPPAIIDRNRIVTLIYRKGTLTMTAEGRAMDRAAAGERIRVMNLESRTTVSGTVTEGGEVLVSYSD
ncbi:flagella basal body P-ring formation protein FlgA [Rhodovulum imhoffii]|uniref:Flagella basal body P-ring formation protein FlgA n=1 Tax=Rhodovulum imhoffii TaxID=365340 RepID=A0A2T5BRR1_9RHOB|nr:flagellar basal body P-ring formation chaperone FlgA [Rhodovulum imhoffii]MBK5934081.1 flagella basal body P-ring formation protein FlgA [Rhodovulum imhoffii]PTN01966.1 flagella basal body P-ring formation protein FlgA [Rhodovulum imhoffii]